jgi:hypothetical protein
MLSMIQDNTNQILQKPRFHMRLKDIMYSDEFLQIQKNSQNREGETCPSKFVLYLYIKSSV